MATFLNPAMTTDLLRTDVTTQSLDVPQVFTNLGLSKNLPIGTILLFPNSLSYLPSYWLPCIGQSLGVEEWSDLYNVLGDAYGLAPEGEFKLPSLHASVPASVAAQGGEYFIIGKYAGK